MRTDCALSPIVALMLTDYDELVRVDLNRDEVESLKHTEGKYFTPRVEDGFRELFLHSTEYMVYPDDQADYLRECDPDAVMDKLRDPRNGGEMRYRFRYKLSAGGWRWVEQIAVGGGKSGLPDGVYLSFLRDVQKEINPDGLADDGTAAVGERNALTGLLREEEFFTRARERLSAVPRQWCVVAIDLEHFKLFNEWYDRSQGDQLLAQIGAKLTRVEKNSGGIACYFGQDDFALLVPYERDQIDLLFDELHELVKNYGSTSVGFMPAFGVSTADGSPVEELYDRASMAARRAKDDYRTRVREFEPEMYEKTDHDYRILSDFQKGLREREIYFQLQPQCRLGSERVVGAESLVRWQKPGGEQVPAGVFVPVLEQYGFITDLDKFVWEEVCAWQKKWIDRGGKPLPISVNVSRIDIFTIDVPEYFDMLLKKYCLDPENIKIEITESAYVDGRSVADTVACLRERGFRVLMDDFGSGYSSLNMLRSLNVDIIKLDARFLQMNDKDQKGLRIMESIVNMAKTMGVPIIVEGVETREESDFLAGLGCSYVQGYLFYRPMTVEDYAKLISDPGHIDEQGFRLAVGEQFHTREFLDRNIFSDTVLNNILGPVGFCLLHGDEIDVARCNEQFCEELKLPGGRIPSVQRFLPPDELKKLRALFEKAEAEPEKGTGGELCFVRADGSPLRLQTRVFFLRSDESGKMFYGSVRDQTSLAALGDDIRLLSRIMPDTVIFVRRRGEGWAYRVEFHGLRGRLGLTQEQLQLELENGSFFERVDAEKRERLRKDALRAETRTEKFSEPFRVKTADGGELLLRAWFDPVHDRDSGVEYIVVLHAVDG
ncbi:MAG: EAL domain-containing protein [Oscillospiraceae bacterium]|nr:EAL domain-containing protein [Oscillospiraceae bacterium]